MSDSRSEYTRRLHHVFEHIDRHIDHPLDLETLASVANFSPFHFHRLFTALVGETVGDYVRRRRLELAALKLITSPDATILQVALSVGFNSAEAFARAFRARFRMSPTRWRKERKSKNRQTDSKEGQEMPTAPSQLPKHTNRSASMNVTIVDREPAHVAYMRYTGPFGEPVSRFWQEKVAPWMGTNSLFGHVRYGVSHDDPTITDQDKLRYDACVEVPVGWAGSGDYQETTIPGGKFACTPFKGTVHEINDAWAALLREWLPESGLQLDSRPFYEYYPRDASFDQKTGIFTCDLCVPVLKL